MRSLIASLLLAGAAQADVPSVLTDFAPVQSLVMEVMGDVGQPTMLLTAGGDPHEFQMRPSQASALAGADLLFWVGPELMPALGKVADGLGSKSVPLLGTGRTRQFEGDEGTDPHAWLDPDTARAWLGVIATKLAAADPDHADAYAANATAAEAGIADLDARLKAELAPARDVPLVVFHDALGYFGDHFGLDIAGAIELGDAATPSAAQIAGIRRTIRDAGAVCVFPEAGRDPAFVATVTEGTGARIGRGQDVEGTSHREAPGPGFYATLLGDLAATVADCARGA